MFPLEKMLVDNGVRADRAKTWADAYLPIMKKYHIDTPGRIAAFFSNVLHECGNFSVLEENLNYSASGLIRTWPSRFKGNMALANSIARNPKAIANQVYANRMGNGNSSSGDGYRYRGRGPIQITGKANYSACAKGIGVDIVSNPELVRTPAIGALVSLWYWNTANVNKYADANDFDGVRDIINRGRKTSVYGDAIGFEDSYKRYKKMGLWFNENHITSIELPN